MSLLDTYRRNAVRKRGEIVKLQSDKAGEKGKIATLRGRINTASQAASRTKNTNTRQSKLKEIERLEQDQARAEKKIAEIEKKIAQKEKELSNEQNKITKEEDREQKKIIEADKKQAREHALRMSRIDQTLTRHNTMHVEAQTAIEKLQRLPEKITVLFLASNPTDQVQLRLDEEARSISDMIRKAKHRDSVVFESRWAIQPMDVLQALNEIDPTIVHFSGHGSDSDQIVFQDAQGQAKLVSKEAIVQTMMASSGSIRLVFFNTCYSRNQAEAVTLHVDAAIGMNTSIGDIAARVFASQFYSSIGFGHSLRRAFDQAKALVMMEGIDEEDTPELFLKDGIESDDFVLVKPPESD